MNPRHAGSLPARRCRGGIVNGQVNHDPRPLPHGPMGSSRNGGLADDRQLVAIETAELVVRLRDSVNRRTVLIRPAHVADADRSEEHTSELQSLAYLVCRLLLEKKKKTKATKCGLQ